MQQGCGETCGDMNEAQALNLCKHGILTGRGLHKLPLPPNSAAPPCSQSQHFAPDASFRLRDPAGFVFLSLLALLPDSSFGCSLHGRSTKGSGSRPFLESLSLSFRNWAPLFSSPADPGRPATVFGDGGRIFLARSSYVSIVSSRRCIPRRACVDKMPS
jgi:hypothetical protein